MAVVVLLVVRVVMTKVPHENAVVSVPASPAATAAPLVIASAAATVVQSAHRA